MRSRLTRVLGAAVAASALLAVAACSKQTNAAAGGGETSAAVDVSAAKAAVEEHKKVPAFVPPGPAFDAGKAKGKTVFYIPLNSSVPFDNLITQASQRAAEAAGVKFVMYANQGQPSQWIQGMNAAIAQKADVIVLEGSPDPKLLRPQIAAAKAAGIPVISTHLYDESYAATALQEIGDLAAIVPANHYKGGTLMADYAVADSGGRVNAFFVTSNEVQPSEGITRHFQDELAKQCPETCKATVVNIPITDWATKVPSAVQTALLKDPKINYVVPVYDGMTQFLAAGVMQAGASGRVKIVAYNGTASVLQMIQKKNLVVADVGEPVEWLGWANIDQALRVLAGVPPLPSQKTPLRIFDASNVDEAGKPANQTDGYGDSQTFINGYKQLWGIS